MTSFYYPQELTELGFQCIGNNVLISRKASIYNARRIRIGSNVRIDDYCVLSAGLGGIQLGDYIHIGVYSCLLGKGQIFIDDYSGLASHVSIYSSSDNYSGDFMTNPTVPEEFTGVIHKDVMIRKYCIVGSGSVILPGVTLNEGCAVGALSLVNRDCEEFYIYTGRPARKLMPRSRDLLQLQKKFQNVTGILLQDGKGNTA